MVIIFLDTSITIKRKKQQKYMGNLLVKMVELVNSL